MGTFVEWATIVGGFAGLLSAIYVFYEKWTSGPKIVLDIDKTKMIISKNHVTFSVNVDIGNSGNEITTLKKVFLSLDGQKFTQSYDVQDITFRGETRFKMAKDDLRTWVIEPGIATVLFFKFSHSNVSDLNNESVDAYLKFEFLNHKTIIKKINFQFIKE